MRETVAQRGVGTDGAMPLVRRRRRWFLLRREGPDAGAEQPPGQVGGEPQLPPPAGAELSSRSRLMRTVNEHILERALAAGKTESPVGFCCECGHERCEDTVPLLPRDYLAACAERVAYVVAPPVVAVGHVPSLCGVSIEQCDW
jgi:hypothetical protein